MDNVGLHVMIVSGYIWSICLGRFIISQEIRYPQLCQYDTGSFHLSYWILVSNGFT